VITVAEGSAFGVFNGASGLIVLDLPTAPSGLQQLAAPASTGAAGTAGEEFGERLAHLRDLTERITARGGKVIFVRLPSKSLVHDEELRLFPRGQFWQRVEDELPGTKVNCDLVPELTDDFTCTDGAHIASGQAAEFTRRLVRHLNLK